MKNRNKDKTTPEMKTLAFNLLNNMDLDFSGINNLPTEMRISIPLDSEWTKQPLLIQHRQLINIVINRLTESLPHLRFVRNDLHSNGNTARLTGRRNNMISMLFNLNVMKANDEGPNTRDQLFLSTTYRH